MKIPTCGIIIKKRKEIYEYMIDETLIKVGSELVWLWVVIDRARKQTNSRTFLANKSNERNMFVAERFLSGLVKDYKKYRVSTDGGTWYPQACEFLTRS